MSSHTPMPEFRGLRILLVEDDLLIAMDMEDVLRDLGCEVVGPYGKLADAISAAVDAAELDGAIIDLNLLGELSFPRIETLKTKAVPCVLCSGYADLPEVRSQLSDIPKLGKPCNPDALISAMRSTFLASANGNGVAHGA